MAIADAHRLTLRGPVLNRSAESFLMHEYQKSAKRLIRGALLKNDVGARDTYTDFFICVIGSEGTTPIWCPAHGWNILICHTPEKPTLNFIILFNTSTCFRGKIVRFDSGGEQSIVGARNER